MILDFFKSTSGKPYVKEFLESLDLDDRSIIGSVLEDIERYGFSAKGCQFRQVEGKLWEIKIHAHSGGYRILYVVLSGGIMMLLHAYKKQGQKIPKHELEVAKKRLKEVLS